MMNTLAAFVGGAVCGGAVVAYFSGKVTAAIQGLHTKADAILAAVRAK